MDGIHYLSNTLSDSSLRLTVLQHGDESDVLVAEYLDLCVRQMEGQFPHR